MPHPASVRLQIAQIVDALEQAATALAGGPAGAEGLTPQLRRAHGTALRLSAYLNDDGRAGHDPGA